MQRNFTAVTGARAGKSAENEALLSQQRAALLARLVHSKDGSIACSVENCVLILENDPVLMGAIRKNLFTGCMVIVGDMPWHRAGSCFTDDDLAFIELLFENHYSITSEKKILTALRIVANSNSYHPVRKYLNHLDWDRTPRVRFALHHFLGAEICDPNEELLRLFMLGAVPRIFQPGCKFDMMLCLTGGQGAGKSSFFRFLAGNDEWFSDDLRKLDDENVYRRIMGHWIIEMSEMMATAMPRTWKKSNLFSAARKILTKCLMTSFRQIDHDSVSLQALPTSWIFCPMTAAEIGVSCQSALTRRQQRCVTATQNKPSIASANSRPIPHSSHMEQWNKYHHKKKCIGKERHIAYSAFVALCSSSMFHSSKVRIIFTYMHQGAIIYDENEPHAVRRNLSARPRTQSEQSQDDLDGSRSLRKNSTSVATPPISWLTRRISRLSGLVGNCSSTAPCFKNG